MWLLEDWDRTKPFGNEGNKWSLKSALLPDPKYSPNTLYLLLFIYLWWWRRTHSLLQENFLLQGSVLSSLLSLFCCVFGKLDAGAGFELCENEALVLSVGCSSQKFGFREAYSIPRTRKRKLALEVITTWALFILSTHFQNAVQMCLWQMSRRE